MPMTSSAMRNRLSRRHVDDDVDDRHYCAQRRAGRTPRRLPRPMSIRTPVVKRASIRNTAFAGVDIAHGNVLSNDFDVDTGDIKTRRASRGIRYGSPDRICRDPGRRHLWQRDHRQRRHLDYILDNNRAATQALKRATMPWTCSPIRCTIRQARPHRDADNRRHRH